MRAVTKGAGQASRTPYISRKQYSLILARSAPTPRVPGSRQPSARAQSAATRSRDGAVGQSYSLSVRLYGLGRVVRNRRRITCLRHQSAAPALGRRGSGRPLGSGKCLVHLKSRAEAEIPTLLRKESKNSIAWCSAKNVRTVSSTGGRARPVLQGGTESRLLLLGSQFGVEAVDVESAEVRWRYRHETGVGAVVFDGDSNDALFCSMLDRDAGRLDVETGKLKERFRVGKHKAKHFLALNGLQKMVIAGSHLLLWDAVNNRKLIKYSGHATDVCAVASSPVGGHFLTAGEEERHVAVWSTAGNVKSAVGILSMDHGASALGTAALPGEEAGFAALALSAAGVVHIWKCRPDEHKKLQPTLWLKIRVQSPSNAQSPHCGDGMEGTHDILSAAFRSSGDSLSVLVVHGNAALPKFETVCLPQSGEGSSVVELNMSLAPLLAGSKAVKEPDSQKKRKREAAVVGPDNDGQPIQAAHFHPRPAKASAPTGSAPQHSEKLTLGECLQLLEKKMENRAPVPEGKKSGLTAASAAVLIHQINQSGDMELYNRAMRLSHDLVVATAKQLSSADAARFLQLCAERLRTRPKEATIVPWIRQILRFHAASIIAVPSMRSTISNIHQAIESRTAMFDTLLQLSGRIDMLLSQIDQKTGKKDNVMEIVPQVMVEVDMEEDVEVEEVDYDMADVSEANSEVPSSDHDLSDRRSE